MLEAAAFQPDDLPAERGEPGGVVADGLLQSRQDPVSASASFG
jgi:hypothetical protein